MFDYSEAEPAPWYALRDSFKTVRVGEGISYVGSHAFADLTAINPNVRIYMCGNAPTYADDAFADSTIYVLYSRNRNYTDDMKLAYGGTDVRWIVHTYNVLCQSGDIETTMGSEATLWVDAVGDGLNYQWEYAELGTLNTSSSLMIENHPEVWETIDGAVGPTLQLTANENSIRRIYRCTITATAAYDYTSYHRRVIVPGEVMASGTAGTNTWTLTSDGHLRIAGTGEMDTSADWKFWKDWIRSVTVENGITSVADSAFRDCRSLQEVTIAPSVTVIGEDAFNCHNVYRGGVERITLSEGLTQIGHRAFKACDRLTEIVIPNTVTSIGTEAFSYCTNLAAVTLGSGLESIGVRAFQYTAIRNLTIPAGVMSIGEEAFRNCRSLTNATIAANAAFGNWVFENCTSLLEATFTEGVTALGHSMFADCTALTAVALPASLTSMDASAFYGCGSLAAVDISADNSSYLISDGCVYTADGATLVMCMRTRTVAFVVPNSVTAIGDYAFGGCGGLTAVTLPNGLQSIGNGAFYNCAGLTEIEIPSGISTLGYSVFNSCAGLQSVSLPATVTSLGNDAFSYCAGLTALPDISHITQFGNFVFEHCTGLTEITLPAGDHAYGDYVFFCCTALQTVHLPNDMTAIPDSMFSGCTALTVLPDISHITQIGSSAFSGCTGLTQITIPASVTSIGSAAFGNCTAITDITFEGAPPVMGFGFEDINVFRNVTATVHFPLDDQQWMQRYSIPGKQMGGTLTWDAPLRIVAQPIISVTTWEGPTTFEVTASGFGVQYQWQTNSGSGWNNSKLETSRNKILELNPARSKLHYRYRCILTDALGNSVTSDEVWYEDFFSDMFFTVEPQSCIGAVDSTAVFSAKVNRSSGVSYQWQIDKRDGNGWANSTLASATTPNLSVRITEEKYGRAYRCVVTDNATGERITWPNDNWNGIHGVYLKRNELEIVGQPADYTGPAGSTATFTVNAQGDGLRYFWCYSTPNQSTVRLDTEYNAPTISVEITEDSDGRQYWCYVYDSYGDNVRSEKATLHIGEHVVIDPGSSGNSAPLSITTQPIDFMGALNETASFTVSASGTGTLQYQWYIKNTGDAAFRISNGTGAQTPTYTAKLTEASNGRQAYCVVTDKKGNHVESDTVCMTIGTPEQPTTLAIREQPSDYEGELNSTASFTVSATGTGELSYQWYIRNTGDASFRISNGGGAQTPTYTARLTEASNGRQAYCVVTDASGGRVQTDTVTMTIGTQGPAAPLTITAQPTDCEGALNSTVSFTVSATGNDLSYQWYIKNTGDARFKASTGTGATSPTYSAKLTEASNGRQAYCVVTDASGGRVQTDTVTMTIGTQGPAAPLTITAQPTDCEGELNSTVLFTVSASGNDLSYQWYIKNTGDARFKASTGTGATSPTYSAKLTQTSNQRAVYCIITDAAGNRTQTRVAIMTVNG